MEYLTLNNGNKMPMAGIGVFLLKPEETELSVLSALADGIRRLLYTWSDDGNAIASGTALSQDESLFRNGK